MHCRALIPLLAAGAMILAAALRRIILARPRMTGDFHGQAPVLWSASALLR